MPGAPKGTLMLPLLTKVLVTLGTVSAWNVPAQIVADDGEITGAGGVPRTVTTAELWHPLAVTVPVTV